MCCINEFLSAYHQGRFTLTEATNALSNNPLWRLRDSIQSQTTFHTNKRSNKRKIQLLWVSVHFFRSQITWSVSLSNACLYNNCNDTCNSINVSQNSWCILREDKFQLFSILFHTISYVNNSLTINCNKPNVNITHDEMYWLVVGQETKRL